MRRGRSNDLVAAGALLVAAGLGGFLLLRAQGAFGERFTDGTRTFRSETASGVRHAVWDAPVVLAGLGEGADPALAPDGLVLVFASGARGLNAELFVAELVDGLPGEPRALTELNSIGDELAPAFGPDGLYFASDRAGGAGGLDLWRAPYERGLFGAPERLGSGLNSVADECDPAPQPGSRALVFASNRARPDFDLYLATPDAQGFFAPAPLVALNSPAEEREPAFPGDARSLYFASDRAGGAGGFDLWRALAFEDGWQAPAPLRELSGAADERGPGPAADGFALWFARAEPNGASELLRARSLELFRVPPPGVSLAQWLTLCALLLLALLALLAKRWSALDVLWKCLLVSLIVHLLLMLYLRTVEPDEAGYDTGTDTEQGTDAPEFRVRLAPDEPAADGRGLTGPLAPERERLTPLETAPIEAPAVAALQAPEREAEVAPERAAELARATEPAPAPELAAPAEASALAAAPAPALALAARAAAAPETAAAGAPERAPLAASLTAASADAQPTAVELAASEASREALALGAAPAEAPERGRESAPAPSLSSPAESFERAGGSAPLLALTAAAPAAREGSGESTPARERLGPAAGAPAPAQPLPGALAAPAAETSEATPARAPLEAAVAASPAGTPGPDLRAPSAPRADPAAPSSASFDATAGLARAAGAPSVAPGAPARESVGSAPAAHERAQPGASAPLAAPAGGDTSAELPARGRALSAPAVADSGPAPELRAPAGEPAAPRAAAPRPTFDATAGLARAASGPSVELGARALSNPERASTGSAPAARERAQPGASAPLAAPAGGETSAELPARGHTLSAPAVADSGPAPELRAPAGEPAAAPRAAAPRPTFDATAGLAAARAPTRAAPSAPERSAVGSAPSMTPAPARPAPLALAPEPAGAATLDDAPAPRLAESPYQNRFGAQKLRALEEFGGTVETEHAVAMGLAYLAGIQGRDGLWGERSDAHEKYLDVRIGKSALALLAFLGAGHVPAGSTEHAAVAARTVAALLAAQDPATGHFGRSCSYGHGIATYALAECFALTQDERLRAPLERALAEILRHQSEVDDPRFLGGWGYYFADGHVWGDDEWPRTSVTAWQVMALESARLGGLSVPDAAFDGARTFLANAWDPRQRAFRYDHDPERLNSGYPILPASTPAALFALSLLGVDAASQELAAARRFVLARMPDGYRYTGDDDFVRRARGNLYFWYYATLAMFRVGGNEWDGWNTALKETLLPAQEADGSWRPIDIYAEYAGDADEERTYTTAMCVLSLEVYYRYFTPLLKVR